MMIFKLLYKSSCSVFSSVTQSCPTLCDPMNCSLPVHHQASLSVTISRSSLKLTSIELVMPSHPVSSPFPPAPNPSQHQSLFQWVNSSHEVDKVLEFHFSISPSKEHPGLISFRMDWLDLLAVQGTLKSLLQQHSSKKSIICAQLSSLSNSHIHTWPLEKP